MGAQQAHQTIDHSVTQFHTSSSVPDMSSFLVCSRLLSCWVRWVQPDGSEAWTGS